MVGRGMVSPMATSFGGDLVRPGHPEPEVAGKKEEHAHGDGVAGAGDDDGNGPNGMGFTPPGQRRGAATMVSTGPRPSGTTSG
jgi:hypothetical protein